ncbi:SDR family NAD(P)-dependent oxidoreductase [Actinokineospora auranticolor]|uniref:Polyketide synthase PksN n=1 Tax=Actinokineospora auranticolor TaxID=155976 RepID=A0A2S6GPJ4_9PSEU|nr:SDR family NAD(P)-dependent oxidoreductase [Actinokineospora auranticolor]PPK67116.1 polyketide synthase PksN [Actinokineospora auranticolor]
MSNTGEQPVPDAGTGSVADTDIAIVGMAGAFPGAGGLDAFWDLLREGRVGTTQFSRDELAAAGVPARLLDDPAYVRAHGVIPGADLFDTGYFEFTPAEAEFTDPQHRVLLTTGHAALEHAGYDPARFDGLISVYAGAAINTYLQQQVLPNVDQTATSDHFAVMVGNDKDFLATRLSYKLDLRGPSYTVQTACSTSLVAIHLACQGLVNGECDMALAGGVTVKLPQDKGYLFEEGAILSEDGYARTFDAGASGTVLGNGVGVLVLKRLREAIADRDTVHAVIKGTATNNDGSGKVSFAAPGAAGQAAVIREAHAVSGVDPRTIGHVEAHGTATRLGDPVEVSALTRAFRVATADTGFCAIGSVKSNIGHLDAAAGVAGVIKTVLMLKNRSLVPTVNFHTPNPAIDFAASPFAVSTETRPWTGAGPLRAGVSSFGIGGTNAHAVLQEAPPAAVRGGSRETQVLVVSARTPTALATAAGELAEHLAADATTPLPDAAYTLAVGRRAHEFRIAVSGTDRTALAAALRAAAAPAHQAAGEVSFTFTEQVSGAAELAAGWSAAEPVFAEHHAAALAAGADGQGTRGQVFALQYALGRLWRHWGVRPVAAHGDGVAARVAACVAGVLPLAAAVADLGTEPPTAATGSRIAVRAAGDAVRGQAIGVADGPWAGLALAWAAGAEVDWAAYYADEERGRVPLPTYPFEGRRCWMTGPVDERRAVAAGPHPMLDENISTLDTLAFRGTRSGSEFYLADHRVDSAPVMPAVGYLEMARAAGELSLGGPVALGGVAFEQLLSYADGPRTALVSLWRDGDAVGFEVVAGDAVHTTGELRPAAPERPGPMDLAAVAARCTDSLGHDDCYALLGARGLDYGLRMRALTEVALGGSEALAHLALPEGAELDGALLNPALLDGALHALVVLLAHHYGEAATGFLPIALGELTVHGAVTGPCRVHVALGQLGERAAHASVTVLDCAGHVLARMRDLAVRVLRESACSALLVRGWTPAPLTAAGRAPEALVVSSDTEVASALGARAIGFDAEIEALPAAVVVDEAEPAQALRIVRRLLGLRPTSPVRVLFAHRHSGEALPRRRALAGLARSVRAENPLLAVQVVGLDGVAPSVLAEELAGPGTDVEVRYGAAGRAVPAFEAVGPETAAVRVRAGGVYVITGGAGGLGRVVAAWLLAQAPDAHVVLVGRSARPEGLDGRLAYRRADVADSAAVAAVLDGVRAEFGAITGAVHAAGVLRDAFTLGKSDEDFAAVLAPKVDGLRALTAATADDELDFLVAFSSIAAHFGSAGQADYATANAYLEAVAEQRGITAVAWPMWAGGGMAQTAEAAAEVAAATGFGVLPTAAGLALLGRVLGVPGAVVAAYGDLPRITAALAAPVAVPTGSTTGTEPAEFAADAADGGSARATALGMLRGLVAGQTRLDPAEIAEEAPFERYGIDSLMITKLNRELDKRFTGLSKTLFFEYATLGELADHFAEQHAAELVGTPAEQAPATSRPARTTTRTRPGAPETGADRSTEGAIAVIGVAGRYPRADDLDEFWANLLAGRDCVTDIPADRWDHTRWYDPDPATPGRAHTRWGGFLRHVDRFDPLFFGISPRQAEVMDPQERLFLLTSWHALEDAGYRRADLSGRQVGVYAGVMYGEYQFHGAADVLGDGGPLTGSSFATIANRVSYALDLSGPSIALDTMCSSSLTAIHLACQSLRRGETDLAIAGGVNVSVHPYKYAFLSQGRFLSSDGRCRAFGEGGDGYVPGEGVGAVLLKPLAAALADGDRVHGVILGSAVNHGAKTNGYTVPSTRAQQRVITSALAEAGVGPTDISYVEAHGTGTALGDPIELTGLTAAYRSASAEPGHWPIGSVKSNIGHLESAAGIAGLTKVLLQFRHRTLVPSLHSATTNPNIDFTRSPFRVQQTAAEWAARGPRLAGLSSFGAGGANAHLVLAESPTPEPGHDLPAARQRTDEPVLFLLSARDDDRLRAYAAAAARFLSTEHVPLADLAHTTRVGREAMGARLAVLADNGADIHAALSRFAEGGPLPDVAGGGDLAERARHWLGGGDVDWRAVTTGRRVAAPLYPFADESYWIPFKADPVAAAPALHPLVDANESTVTELRLRKTLTAADPLLRDHVIDGRPVLAGAATLEFVRVAAGLLDPGTRHALREVVWGRAVEPTEDGLDLFVSFRPQGDSLAFEVHSSPVGGAAERVVHARGVAVAADSGPLVLDPARIEQRLTPLRDRAATYADYAAAGFAYGPSFQVVDEICTGPGEALVRLSGARTGIDLPPALLDGALRACHWVDRTTAPRAGELAVPFSLGSLELLAPLPSTCLAHARLVGETAGVRRFDVTITDERGSVLAVLRDFAGRDPRAPVADAAADPGRALLYAPVWRAAAAAEPAPSAVPLVVVGDLPGLVPALSGTRSRVVTAELGDGLAGVLVGLGADDVDVAFVDGLVGGFDPDAVERVSLAMSDVLHATSTGRLAGRVRVVAAHGADRPEWAALAGFAKSTAAVAPRFELLVLELPAAPVAEVAAAITAELAAADRIAGVEVRRTATGREVRGLRPVTDLAGAGSPVRDGAVCVVTGGRGAIGRVLAEHLVRTHRARLVLINRSEPDAGAAAWQRELGTEVLALRADVTDADSLGAALAAARARFGSLNAVFHLAGVADDGRADGDRARFAGVLAAKTRGLVALDRLTAEDDLDAFVVFSSLSSLVGDFGAVSYATANRFADRYTELRETWSRPGRGLSLAWPLWSVGGVDGLVSAAELAAYTRHSHLAALTAEQGMACYDLAMRADTPWLVPAWGDPAVLDAALTGQAPTTAQPTAPIAAAADTTADGAQRERLVAHLRGALSGVLKLPSGTLDSRVALDGYGLDSVLMMETTSLLGKDFPGLRGTVFFECRTVDELADHVLAEHADAVAALFPRARADTAAQPAAPQPSTAQPSAARPATVVADPVRPRPEADEPIAVIGISGRYPRAADLGEFWANLAQGLDCVSTVPADRWDAEALYAADPRTPGRSYGRWGGFLSDVDSFDSLFFQIAPAQARTMDPQERLFLETAWSALEDAGYPPSRLPAPAFGGQGHDVGVFVGVMWDDYAVLAATESARGNHQVVLANRSSIANQVSFFCDFRGPSVVVDTACSASLVAVHQACESIRRGECAYAIAGGVNVAVHPDKYVHLSHKTMLSTDGKCRAFGAGGDGYVPGEGVGAVLLKRLSEAERDGDTVHAVIRATAVNHGGRTSGYTVPNPQAQQALVEQALAAAGVDARSIGCLEAHGTGTALGDPIEHTALAGVYGRHTADTGFCALGSVKSAIGHLEGAAGIAGLTKAVLQLRNATLLPTLHADELNPIIDFTRSPFAVQRETAPWVPRAAADGTPLPRRAAVSSFGAGGTNAHVVLEEYRPAAAAPDGVDGPELVVLSARDEPRLREYAARLGAALATADGLRLTDVAHTLRVGREPMAERLAFVATDLADAAAKLSAIGGGEGGQWLHRGRVRQNPELADLFTAGAGGEEFLTAQVRAGQDDLLGRLWVSGVAVDWAVLDRLRPRRRRRVPLPTYPFARVRHWLDTDTRPTQVTPEPPGPWQHVLAATDPVVADHVVGGRAILPGVGHLDLVARARGGLVGQAFADVRWVVPVVVTGSGERVGVRFDGDRYQVVGEDEAVRSTGRLLPATGEPGTVDVAALRAALTAGPEHEAFYRLLSGQGLPYGPFFRRVSRVWTGEDEVLGRIGTGPDGGAAHPLHPGVLDAALHTVAALLVRRRGEGARPMLPFAVDRVDVFGPVPDTGWSHVRETGPDRCDVTLTDESGAVRVRFTGLAYRESKPATAVGYIPRWEREPAAGAAEPADHVLLVGTGLDSELAAGIVQAHRGARISRLPVGLGGLGEAELDRALRDAAGTDLVYFLAADAETAAGPATERGVVALYRLLRALDRRGALDRPLRLKVVTTDAHPLEAGDESRPWSAGLAGVAMVAAKEFTNLRVSLVDVRSAEAASVAARVATEPFGARTSPVSLRGGVRRVRVLRRAELPPARTRFRRGGTYLVVGGLGTVGRDTCRHLAATYGANLVVVGRSPLDDTGRAFVAELERAGGRVRHLSLDATDPVAVAGAVATAKREFGGLNGVVHAAMVLVNRVIRELPEAELRAAADTKVDSTTAVLAAVRDEPLDFALLYSSGVVFDGNHGQAGYAAGCAFADAYAHHAARTLPFPVRVLNLGYWHAGGDPAREEVLRRLTAAGVRPLTAERGMDVVERVLAADLPQVLGLDADQRILDTLGIPADGALVVTPGAVAVPPQVLPGGPAPDPELAAHQRAVAEGEELAQRLLAAALDRAGLFAHPGTWASRAELAARLGVVTEHAPLFRAQLDVLVGAGYLVADGDRVRGADRAVEPEAETLRALAALVAGRPSVAPLAELLRDCLAVLPDVLAGRANAMEVLFPGGSPDRVAAVYRGDPVTDRCNAEVARLVVEQVRARAAGGARVRVLEVGAGTGGTSAGVLAALAPLGDSVEYVFTDLSPTLVRKGRARFGAAHPFARFEVLDIESTEDSGYDVVLGTNVFHATPDLSRTVARAKRLLRAGGVFLAVEGTRPQHQPALVFGLTAGWWLFTDPEQRLPGSPLATERQWRDVLAAAGFRGLSAAAPTTGVGPAFQSVIAAVSDGVVPLTAAPAEVTVPAERAPVAEPVAVGPAGQARTDALAEVTGVFARVLEMAADDLDPDLTFEHYGVDSLVTIELTRALEAVYGPQPATLLFERITIRGLAEHLGGAAPAPAGRAPTPAPTPPPGPADQVSGPVEQAAGAPDAVALVESMSDEAVDALLAELLSGHDSEGGGR